MAKEKRFILSLSENEHKALKKLADTSKVSMAEWLRGQITDKAVYQGYGKEKENGIKD